MRIQYMGHSCFRIISETGTAVMTDPYDESAGLLSAVSADVVTVSHRHHDHDFVEGVSGNPAVLEKEVYLACDDIAIQSIHSFHDDKKGALRGENFVFCFLVDGLKVVHMGDVGELNEDLAKQIALCDVLMIPVGGVFTVDAAGAKWYVDKVRPKIVLPMHYKTAEHRFEIDSLDKFTNLFNADDVRYQHSETLVLEDVPENTTPRVVILDKYRD